MSERMNKERAREELRDRKILAEIEYNQSEDAKKKDNLLRYIKALDIAIESLDNEWVDVSKNGTPKENSMCAVMVEGDRFDGSGFVPDITLLPYFVFYNSEEDYWVDVYGVVVPTDIVAWKKVEPYERKE